MTNIKQHLYRYLLRFCSSYIRQFIADVNIWLLDPESNPDHVDFDFKHGYCWVKIRLKTHTSPCIDIDLFSPSYMLGNVFWSDYTYYPRSYKDAIGLTIVEKLCVFNLFKKLRRAQQSKYKNRASLEMQEYVLKEYKSLLQK